MNLPYGVEIESLVTHVDERGSLTPLFRRSALDVEPLQWNLARSRAGTLRGVHCHPDHDDFIVVIEGSMILGLHDLRPGSPTEGTSATIDLCDVPVSAYVPAGVAHGFWFPRSGTLIYGTTVEWADATKLGCRWNDPGLGVDWDVSEPELSERDATAGSLNELRDAVHEAFRRA